MKVYNTDGQILQSNAGGGGGGITNINISAGTTSNNLSKVTIDNAGGVSFGLNGSVVTAVAPAGAPNVSAGTTSNNLGTMVFSNSNGVSFGLNGSTVTATVKTDYLTTAMASNRGSDFVAATAAFAGTSASGTIASDGISISIGPYLTTAMQSNAATISNILVSAGTTSNLLSAVTFSNSNNVSFGLNGSTMTATVTVASTQGSLNLSAGTTSNLSSQFSFADSNRVSFGLNAGTITAKHALNFSAGTTSQNVSDQLVLSNSNNVSFGLNGSTITATVTVASTQGSINLSAGTTSNNGSAFVFSNSNNVSFGLNGSTVTATITVPSQTNQTVGLYASSNTYLTSSGTVDARSLSFRGDKSITVGISAGEVVFSVGAYLTTAMLSNAATISNVNLSAGTTSNNLSAFVFSNSNNVSFGLNGSTVTATITVPAQTNQSLGVYMSSNTTSSVSSATIDARSITFRGAGVASVGYSGGEVVISVPAGGGGITNVNLSAGTTSQNLSNFVFSNSNNVSFGLNGSTITGTVTVASTQGSFNLSAGTTSNLSSQFSFANSNRVSFGLNAGTITAQHALNFSAGTTSQNVSDQIVFSNSNNVSFGLNGSTITATITVPAQTAQTIGLYMSSNTTSSVSSGTVDARSMTFRGVGVASVGFSNGEVIVSVPAGGGGITNINLSAGTTSQNLSAFVLSNSNNATFGLNGSTVTVSSPISISAGTTNNNFTNVVFSNSNNISFGLNGSTITGSVVKQDTIKYWVNYPHFNNTDTQVVNQSTSVCMPLNLQAPLSFDFVRFIRSGSILAASTTRATTGGTQFSCGYTRSHNFVLYSRLAGASSQSLGYYYSTQILENFSNNVSAAANSTQFSYSNRYSFPCSTGTTGFTHDYSSSAASLNFNSASATMLTARKQMDFKFGTTLSAGEWFLMYGASSTSSSQFTSLGFRNIVTFNNLAIFGANLAMGPLGSATQATMNGIRGLGSFSTAGGGTTSSLGFTNISTSNSNIFPYLQFMVTF